MSSATPKTPRRTLFKRVAVPATMAMLAVVSLVLWLNLRDSSTSGAVVEVDSQVTGTSAVVNVPYGAMTFTVTEPLEELPLGVDDELLATSAHWVGVSWATVPTNVSKTQQSLGLDFARPAKVVLVADDDRYDLLADRSEQLNSQKPPLNKAVFVSVPKAPTEVVVEVIYDGVTQKFTPGIRNLNTGKASSLYAAPTWTISAPECDEKWTISAPGFQFYDGDNVVTCRIVGATSVAYLEGKGWAEEGRSWLIVPILTNALDPFATWPALETDPSEIYPLKLRATTVEINGEAPVSVLSYYQDAPDQLREGLTGAQYVFDVPYAGNRILTFEQGYDSDSKTSDVPGAPDRAAGTASFTATLKQTP